ncbi:competence protein ComFB [Natranaerovirga hydrolytica]|uniref:Competence protein ComFB n=1 Tax=Natranaerovirga hydrolytica TaxID=680378 RepID=A0A4R1MEF3_9FIRM|nr:late competence development ComFB family protein [Natranaerovirga hydrolytica]TCK90595.1 competence protein ComFB [Natranaerovirga hydrolytica]
MVKNYMEDVVDKCLTSLLHNYPNVCRCSICLDDIKAIALNQLKPIYFVEEKGDAYSRLNELTFEFKSSVIKELIKSIEIVSNNPKHIKK